MVISMYSSYSKNLERRRQLHHHLHVVIITLNNFYSNTVFHFICTNTVNLQTQHNTNTLGYAMPSVFLFPSNVISSYHIHVYGLKPRLYSSAPRHCTTSAFINPQHACTARVTALGLCARRLSKSDVNRFSASLA